MYHYNKLTTEHANIVDGFIRLYGPSRKEYEARELLAQLILTTYTAHSAPGIS